MQFRARKADVIWVKSSCFTQLEQGKKKKKKKKTKKKKKRFYSN
jgi:hypothetical protein